MRSPATQIKNKMRSPLPFFFIALSVAFSLSSCSVVRRIHTPGYHIEWSSSKHSNRPAAAKPETATTKSIAPQPHETTTVSDEQTSLSASLDNSSYIIPAQLPHLKTKKEPAADNERVGNVTTALRQTARETKKILKKQSATGEGGYSGMAIAGFVCSVVGLILFVLWGWPFLLGTLGVIFSAIGLSGTRNDGQRGKGLAIAGLIVGILDILLFWILVAIIASFVLLALA